MVFVAGQACGNSDFGVLRGLDDFIVESTNRHMFSPLRASSMSPTSSAAGAVDCPGSRLLYTTARCQKLNQHHHDSLPEGTGVRHSSEQSLRPQLC
jgi:hypothetical protein